LYSLIIGLNSVRMFAFKAVDRAVLANVQFIQRDNQQEAIRALFRVIAVIVFAAAQTTAQVSGHSELSSTASTFRERPRGR
jgi:hypothetical protein